MPIVPFSRQEPDIDESLRPSPTHLMMAAATMHQLGRLDQPTKKFRVPINERENVEFEYSDYMGGRDEGQRRLMDPKRKDLEPPELTPEEAETVPGRRIL